MFDKDLYSIPYSNPPPQVSNNFSIRREGGAKYV